jgi:hypothetical protein
MLTIHPQYIKDAEGKDTMVIIPVQEFNEPALMDTKS